MHYPLSPTRLTLFVNVSLTKQMNRLLTLQQLQQVYTTKLTRKCIALHFLTLEDLVLYLPKLHFLIFFHILTTKVSDMNTLVDS